MLVQQFYQSPAPFCAPPVVGPGAPVNTPGFPPAVTGPALVDGTLNCTTGTWTNSPTGYAYQWFQAGPPPEPGDALTDDGIPLTVDGEELTI